VRERGSNREGYGMCERYRKRVVCVREGEIWVERGGRGSDKERWWGGERGREGKQRMNGEKMRERDGCRDEREGLREI